MEDIPKFDVRGIYGSNVQAVSAEGRSCIDCKYDVVKVVNGEYTLCQHPNGGKEDLSCYKRKEIVRGGKVIFVPTVKNVGNKKAKGRESKLFAHGMSLADIAKKGNATYETVVRRYKNNPDISLEELMRAPRKMGGGFNQTIYKGVYLKDIAKETGIHMQTLRSRLKRDGNISLEELKQPLKRMATRKKKK